jgi:hypothetical protein
MKNILLLSAFCFITSFSYAQDGVSWLIYHNNRIILTGYNFSDEKKNIAMIKSNSLDSSGSLIVEYSEMNTVSSRGNWIRIIEIVDKHNNILYKKDSTQHLEINNRSLKKLSEGRRKLKIYTWAHPGKESGIRVRIRRVHLCTLELK